MSTKRQAATLKRRINRYVKSIHRLYEQYNSEAAQMSITIVGEQTDKAVPTDERKPFKWKDYPQVKRQVERMQERFTADIYSLVENGVRVEWQNANGLQDAMVNQVLQRLGTLNGVTANFIEQYQSYYSTNSDALEAFLNRRQNGLNLSQRCWVLSEEYKQGLEAAIACGIQKGTSAVELSKQISKYLVDFPKLRKDYKQMFGQATNVGDCEWRAVRLARTEINMSYRTAEQERWRALWFVVGYEIKLSDTHSEDDFDVCDVLQGKYPKSFVWNGWHPNCKCYQLPIMMSREEQNAWDGEGEPPTDSKNAVKDLPQNFKDWVKDNAERINNANSQPYFIRDNEKDVFQLVVKQLYDEDGKMQTGFVVIHSDDYKYMKLADGSFQRYGTQAEGRTAREQWAQIQEKINEVKQPFADACNEVLSELPNTKFSGIAYKTQGSAIRKADDKFGGDISQIEDLVRCNFVCRASEFEQVCEAIRERLPLYKDLSTEEYMHSPVKDSYVCRFMNVRFENGQTGEIMVTPFEMIAGRESREMCIRFCGQEAYDIMQQKANAHNIKLHQGHLLYERMRIAQTKEERRAIQQEMFAYYDSLTKYCNPYP